MLGGTVYCQPCADEMFSHISIPPAEAAEKVTYNTVLRVLSAFFAVFCAFVAIVGLLYFAQHGITERIVDIINIIIAIACFLMAFSPQWVSATLRIKLEKVSVFGIVLAALAMVYTIANLLSLQPPEV